MANRGLLVRLRAKQGRDAEVEEFLRSALPMIEEEPDTLAWFAVRFGRGEYGIFDVFPDDAGRTAHLGGPVAVALMQRAGELFESLPRIQKVDVLAAKLPVVSAFPDTKGMLLMFKAKQGHDEEVQDFFLYAQEQVNSEHNTTAWFAFRAEDGEYGIFDVFPSNEGRFLHLIGHVPRELARQAFTLLGSMPDVEMLNVQAEKIGSAAHQAAHP